MSNQPVTPSVGFDRRHRSPAFSVLQYWYGHDAPSVEPPFLNRSIWSDASSQYFLMSGLCFLSSAIDRRELLRVELVRILDPERRLFLREVERRVGDLDRVVRDRDLALVRRVVDHRPAVDLREILRVVEQDVRPELQRDPSVLAVDRVGRRRLNVAKNSFQYAGISLTSTSATTPA